VAGKLVKRLEGGRIIALDLKTVDGDQGWRRARRDEIDDLIALLAPARRVIVDLRVPPERSAPWLAPFPIYPALVSRQVQGPAMRSLLHSG
jgi:hypothetical protein